MSIGGTGAGRGNGAIAAIACAAAAAGALFLFVAACLTSPSMARAAGATPVFEVTPASIAPATGIATAVLTLRNPGSDPLTQVRLGWFVNGPGVVKVASTPLESDIRSVDPGGAIAWTIEATPDAGAAGATVWFRVDFTTVPASPSPGTSAAPVAPFAGVATASLQLTPIALSADVTVKGGSGTLTQETPLTVAVVVTNTSPESVSVGVAAHEDIYVTITPQDDKDGRYVDLQPSDTAAFSFKLTAGGSVQPGDRTLLFDVTLKAHGATRVLTTDHTVTLSIFGDAELSSLLGTPAFFLVPGLIVLVVWQLVGTACGRLTSISLPSMASKEFWVLGIGISLAFAAAYPYVTAFIGAITPWLHGGRDYLVGRGTLDLFLVWAFAFAVPVAIYTAGSLYELRVRRDRVNPRDKPLDLIRKLALDPKATNGTSGLVFDGHRGVVVKQQPGDDQMWVAAPVLLEWTGEADVSTRTATRWELWTAGNLNKLYSVLKQAESEGKVLIRYDRDDPSVAPAHKPPSQLQFTGVDLIVKEAQG
jgi:hypothetical protein